MSAFDSERYRFGTTFVQQTKNGLSPRNVLEHSALARPARPAGPHERDDQRPSASTDATSPTP